MFEFISPNCLVIYFGIETIFLYLLQEHKLLIERACTVYTYYFKTKNHGCLCRLVSVFKFPTLFVMQYSLVLNNLGILFIKINRSLHHLVQIPRCGGIWTECFNWPDVENFLVLMQCFHTAQSECEHKRKHEKRKILIIMLVLVLILASKPFSR